MHAKTGNIFEWNGLYVGSGGRHANCITYINSSYYLGTLTPFDSGNPSYTEAKVFKEDNTVARSYLTTYPAKIYTTWLTAGEPSLEKEVLQLKLFGRISASIANPILVKHYKDWNISTLITDTSYVPSSSAAMNSQLQYSHKKRLNSDKCLAASIGIELNSPNSDFELESIEVEFNPIQAGMKR